MNDSAMRADLVNRVKNAVNDLRNEWASAGVLTETVALEMSETPTGVAVSLIVKVGKADKETPLSKKRIEP